ncbi:MAG TPA: serine/threonine-protein kinase [Polyangia bacterium]|nr:serine/threonine-protein kinase [Polyangia bacterium]
MIGETVNNYKVSELLGEGGMGAVYLAEHPFMGRKAAIKVLRREFAEDRALVERFMNEARAANAIRHPNIIDIIDVGRMPSGIPYLMMEFLEGESLASRLRRGTLPIPEALDVILQTASALAAAHTKGIVHRDLKPDNLYLVPDEAAPGGIRVKVLDFGIAKLRDDLSGGMAKTQAGALMGTPPYMSPEQCRGITDAIDHRTDVYAMGIILYEMLCGAPPFMSEGWGDVVLAHLTKPPPSPRMRNATIPESLELVIMKALAKEPTERFSTAADLRSALRAMMGGVATFPPRATDTLSAMQTIPRGASLPAKTPTTFRTATGEVSSLNPTVAETPDALRPKSKKGLVIGGIAALATVGGIGYFVTSGGSTPNAAAVTPPAAVVPATTAPAVTAPAAAASAPKPAAHEPAPAATQILVRLASDPPGALVTDAKRGVVIGATPFEQRFDRKPATLAVRLAKDGFANADLDIPLGADFEKSIRLERQKTHAPSHGSASAKKPSSGSSAPAAKAAAAAAPTTAPPPVTSTPAAPVAKPKATDKW